MPLTREFKETVQARIKADRKYRKELLREGVECLLAGDLDTGKAILRDTRTSKATCARANGAGIVGPPRESAQGGPRGQSPPV